MLGGILKQNPLRTWIDGTFFSSSFILSDIHEDVASAASLY